MIKRLSYLLAGLLTAGVARAADPARLPDAPSIPVVAHTLTPPVIDGVLGDACWKSVPAIEGSIDLRTGKPHPDQTRVRFTATDECLYAGVEALCPRVDKLTVLEYDNEGPKFFQGSTVELFFRPAAQAARYFQFGINPWNARYDADTGNAVWDGRWKAKSQTAKDRWTAEFEIPFETLVPDGKPSGRWTFNVARVDRFTTGESFYLSYHNLGQVNFHHTEKFGPLRFASTDWQKRLHPPAPSAKPLLALTDDLTIWYADDWTKMNRSEKIRRDPKALVSEVRLAGAKHEWVTFQAVLSPVSAKPVTVSCDLGDGFKRVDGTGRIDARHVTWRKVAQVNDLYAEVLVPAPALTVEGAFNRGVWFSAYIPPETPAGDYRAVLTFLQNGRRIAAVPVRLTVWDFALPDSSTLFTTFFDFRPPVRFGASAETLAPYQWITLENVQWVPLKNGQEGWMPMGPGMNELYCTVREILHRHRISPMTPTPIHRREVMMAWGDQALTGGSWIDTWTRWAQWWDERGYPLGSVDYYMTTDPEKIRPYYDRWCAYLREKGWLDKVYANTPIDEPDDQDQEAEETVIRWAKAMRQMAPGLKLQVNLTCSDLDPAPKPHLGRWRASKGLKAYEGLIDLWLQQPKQFVLPENLAFFQRQKDRGGKLGWYMHDDCYCSQPMAQHRSFFWRMMRYDIDFFIVYMSNAWHNIDRVEPGPRYFWKGGGYPAGLGLLIWPGPDNQLYESLRLEVIRDGIEDHEYFTLLKSWQRTFREHASRDTVKDEQTVTRLLALVDTLVQSPTKASPDPGAYAQVRRQWGETLEKLARKYPRASAHKEDSDGR